MEANSYRRLALPLRIIGAGLLIATAAIHLDLYLTGYRTIPTIGWLFLLQVIAAFALAIAVLAAPLVARTSWQLPAATAAAGAGFAIATLGGYLLSLWIGLFGFREVRTTAGLVAGIIEILAFAALALLTIITLPTTAPAPIPAPRTPAPTTADASRTARASGAASGIAGASGAARASGASGSGSAAPGSGGGGQATNGRAPARWTAMLQKTAVPGIAGLAIVAFAVLGASVATANSGSSAPATASGPALLKTGSVGGATLLTNSKGLTLYWFAPDTSTKSACYGTCASYWPPVYGSPAVATGVTGVTGKLGTIHRTDGTTQATYNGHPLYTYVGDTAPGQASGNNLNLNGGSWHDIPTTH